MPASSMPESTDPRPAAAAPALATAFAELTVEEAAARLEVSLEQGLGGDQVSERRARFGRNEIEEGDRRGPFRIFADQFRDFMIGVLVAAAVVAGALGELRDAAAILAIVVLNALLGAIQEIRADRALAALRDLARPDCRVRREGKAHSISPLELVPGDVVLLAAGDLVPADLRLARAPDLQTDESALTGESQPVDKNVSGDVAAGQPAPAQPTNLAFGGTLVTRGAGEGLVFATGMATELGRIAALLGRERPAAPLQRRLADFGRRLAVGVLALCALIFVLGVWRGEEPGLMFLTAVSMAVAAIPEALPAVVTIALALGSRLMVAHKALVRHLPATEALGSVTVICSDKTGTLTRNRMRVERVWVPGEGWRAALAGGEEPLTLACAVSHDLSRDGERWVGDPTELALVAAAAAAGSDPTTLAERWPLATIFAFDAERRRMATVHRTPDGRTLTLVKGAPEEVVGLCRQQREGTDVTALDASAALAAAGEAAAAGERVLAIAAATSDRDAAALDRDEAEADLVLVGLAALLDPPRPEVPEAVATCRSAGIRPVMITGDHPATALAIARQIGIADADTPAVTGAELAAEPADAPARIAAAGVFARVTPEQKISIVETLQGQGELVAMTGDGVNDAPALRRADVGVAMGVAGTDVAREAADLVLLDDNFATLVAAVREGRRIYDNIRRFVRYTLTSNSGELWTLILAPFLGFPVPLLPVQILWINLVTDGLPGLALTRERAEHDVMARPPRRPDESIFAHGLWQHMIVIGLVIGAVCLGLLAWAYNGGSPRWRTLVFTALTLCQLAHALAIRSESRSLLAQGLLTNRPLLGAVALTLGLQLAVVYHPWLQGVFHTRALTLGELGLCLALPLVVLAAVEIEKALVRRRLIYVAGSTVGPTSSG